MGVSLGDFSKTFDDFPIPIFLLDTKGKFQYINKAAENLCKYKSKELLNKNFKESGMLTTKDMLHAAKGFAMELLGKKPKERHVFELIAKDKSKVYVQIHTHLLKQNNKTKYVIGVAEDVTEKHTAEESLKESEEKYKVLFENAGDAIFIADEKGNFVDVNQKACELLNCSKKELCKKKIIDIYDKKPPEEVIENQIKTAISGQPFYLRHKINNNGNIIDLEINITLASKDPVRIVGIARNTTEEKKLLNKIKKLEEDKIKLTNNEKLVFYALARWPDLNDQELSDKIKVKRSTVTAIKNKLKKEEYYRVLRIPSPALFECKYLKIHKHKFRKDISSIFVMESEKDSLLISVEKEIGEGNHDHIYFPLKETSMQRFFDFADMLKNIFELTLDHREEFEFNRNPRSLTKKEKVILYALIKYPDVTDTKIAEITDSARATVSNIKNDLLSEKYLKTVILPNFKKIGMSLLIMTHTLIHQSFAGKHHLAAASLKHTPNTFMMMFNDKESISIAAYKEYAEYKQLLDRFMLIAEKRGMLSEKPDEIVIPLDSLEYSKIDFVDIVKNCLGIRKDI